MMFFLCFRSIPKLNMAQFYCSFGRLVGGAGVCTVCTEASGFFCGFSSFLPQSRNTVEEKQVGCWTRCDEWTYHPFNQIDLWEQQRGSMGGATPPRRQVNQISSHLEEWTGATRPLHPPLTSTCCRGPPIPSCGLCRGCVPDEDGK